MTPFQKSARLEEMQKRVCGIHPRRAGFSLIELMVIVGMIGVTSVVMASMFTQQFKASRTLENRAVARDLTDAIMNLLSNSTACVNTFGGQNPNTYNMPSTVGTGIKNVANAVEYRVGQYYPPAGVGRIQLTSVTLGPPSTGNIGANQEGNATLTMTWTLGTSAQVIGSSIMQAVRNIYVRTNGSTVIQACSSTLLNQNVAQFVCNSLGGTYVNPSATNPSGVCYSLALRGAVSVVPLNIASPPINVSASLTTSGAINVNGAPINLNGAASQINMNP